VPALSGVELEAKSVNSVNVTVSTVHHDDSVINGQLNSTFWRKLVNIGFLGDYQIELGAVFHLQHALNIGRPLPISAASSGCECASGGHPQCFRDVHIRLSLNVWDGDYPWPFNARRVGL
jgi:hypothetical protein